MKRKTCPKAPNDIFNSNFGPNFQKFRFLNGIYDKTKIVRIINDTSFKGISGS